MGDCYVGDQNLPTLFRTNAVPTVFQMDSFDYEKYSSSNF